VNSAASQAALRWAFYLLPQFGDVVSRQFQLKTLQASFETRQYPGAGAASKRDRITMKNFIIAIAAATALTVVAASAGAEERKDNSSTLTGAAIGAGTGAIIAGPPGAVVGGVVGAVVGGPKIVYYQGHRSYTDGQRHYYWDNHRRHYYVVVE